MREDTGYRFTVFICVHGSWEGLARSDAWSRVFVGAGGPSSRRRRPTRWIRSHLVVRHGAYLGHVCFVRDDESWF